jgi:hypothetical protein
LEQPIEGIPLFSDNKYTNTDEDICSFIFALNFAEIGQHLPFEEPIVHRHLRHIAGDVGEIFPVGHHDLNPPQGMSLLRCSAGI